MAVTISIPTALRRHTQGVDSITADGKTIEDVLSSMAKQFPALAAEMSDASGKLRRTVNIYLNGDDIRGLQEKATPVHDRDEISIVTPIAGG